MAKPQAYVVVANRKGGGSPEDLRSLLQEVARNPDITVNRVSGEPPTTVQITAPASSIGPLRQRFGDKLIIEPDAPLKLL